VGPFFRFLFFPSSNPAVRPGFNPQAQGIKKPGPSLNPPLNTLPPKAATSTIPPSSPGYGSATFVVNLDVDRPERVDHHVPHSGSQRPPMLQQLHRSRPASSADRGLHVLRIVQQSGATYTMTSGTERARSSPIRRATAATRLATGHRYRNCTPWARPSRSPFRLGECCQRQQLHRSSHCRSGLTRGYTSSGSCSNAGATYTMTSGTEPCSVIANQAGNAQLCRCATGTETVNALGEPDITFTTPHRPAPPTAQLYRSRYC